jgi:transcription elongation factor Elf1/uncharacterized membrane protein
MRRRLEFAMNERQQKVKELEQIRSQAKGVAVSGILHTLLGDSTTRELQMQQMQARVEDINSQIRALDFEINTLRSALFSSSSKPMHYQIANALTVHRFTCPNCGVSRTISEITFERMKKDGNGMCKTCFTPFKVNVDETTDTVSFESLKERARCSSTTTSSTTGSSIEHRFTCPNCGASRNVSNTNEEVETIKKQPIGICKTCYALFKFNIDEKTDRWSFESLRENPTFYIHSPSLNTDLAYTEVLMPDSVRENLLNLANQLEKGNEIGARGELENIYTTYPTQVGMILFNKGLTKLVMPFSVVCQRCWVGIPRARLGNCPICKDAAVQKKTGEDPMQILKLRLAKGEISKEEYEDLKKSVGS